MAFGQREPTVRVVNRVRDENDKPVRYEFMFGGEQGWIDDALELPIGAARVIIHRSMFRLDPVTNQPHYRLGCADLGAEETLIPVADTRRTELIDRSLLTPDRQLGAKDKFGRTLSQVSMHNPITPRRDAPMTGPRPTESGAQPGTFERF